MITMRARRATRGANSSRAQATQPKQASLPIQRSAATENRARSGQARPQPHSFGTMGISAIEAASGVPGRPLPEPLRGHMEAAFNADFSDVRVHEDATANALDAMAYTHGAHIHFAPGTFQPNSRTGQEIVGHELTHVVQQRQGQVHLPVDATGAINEDPRLEREAENLGQQVARGQPVSPPSAIATGGPGAAGTNSATGAVQRAPKRKRSSSVSSSEESESSSSEESESSSSEESEEETPEDVARLQRSYYRNVRRKARPVNDRSNYDAQTRHNYGYTHTTINEGPVKATFRRGYGNQPFLSLRKEDYGDAVVGTDYDALVKTLKGVDDEGEAASDILGSITEGHDLDDDTYSNEEIRAAATLSGLTQFIEPHNSRIPSADKWARASLRRIGADDSTFEREFNRATGNFLPGRAKKGGSRFGGQEAARALLGISKPRDQATFDDVYDSDVERTLSYLSSSSEEELSSSEEELSSSSDDERSDSSDDESGAKGAKRRRR